MNILTIDCEYNQPSGKCIEIGAAAFKANSGELLATFQMYVNPLEPITQYITDLTTITDEKVANAPDILTAYVALRDFAKKNKCFRNPLVWGSGTRNDSLAIYQEAYPTVELRKENANFMGFRVIDAKTTVQSIQIMHNKSVAGGLAKTCERMNIPFEGEPHTALADAIMTFRVWHFLIKQFPVKGYK
jgi:DNA polymerase III epsilon subunit-like protein